jgi:hypothetical protein
MGIAVMKMSFAFEAKMIGKVVHGCFVKRKKGGHTRLGRGKQK